MMLYNKKTFTSFFFSNTRFLFFSWFHILGRTFCTIVNKSSKSGHIYLFLILNILTKLFFIGVLFCSSLATLFKTKKNSHFFFLVGNVITYCCWLIANNFFLHLLIGLLYSFDNKSHRLIFKVEFVLFLITIWKTCLIIYYVLFFYILLDFNLIIFGWEFLHLCSIVLLYRNFIFTCYLFIWNQYHFAS